MINSNDLKNRKLFLNEYDDNGNLLESRELDPRHIRNLIQFSQYASSVDLMRLEQKEKFTSTEWNRLKDLECRLFRENFNFDDAEYIDLLKELFSYPKEKYDYILSLVSSQGEKSFINCDYNSPYPTLKFTLIEAIQFVNSRSGVYYAVNNEGQKTYDFIEVPTLRQATNRRNKHGDRIVFLSFQDWKEYAVSENELK